MKADYKNWMPRGLIFGNAAVSSAFLTMGLLCRRKTRKPALRLISTLGFTFAGVGFLSSAYLLMLYRIFSYKGKRKLAKHIIDGVAAQIKIPAGGRGLDVGCGSGALTIAAAKRNPAASFVGADRWGREYGHDAATVSSQAGAFFYPSAYGDIQAFLKSLQDEGYAEVRLIPTADGLFVKKCEARWMMIADSALLMGIK